MYQTSSARHKWHSEIRTMPREDIYKKTNQKGVDGVLRDHSLWYRSPGLAPALKGAGTKRLPEPGRKVSVSKLP